MPHKHLLRWCGAHHEVGRQQGLHLALAAVGLPDRKCHVEAVLFMPGQQGPSV